MKKIEIILLFILLSVVANAQEAKSLMVTAGQLSSLLTNDEKNAITNLSLIGTIDARDFKTMRDSMPVLSNVDISKVKIDRYNGFDGSGEYYNTNYYANEIPYFAFSSQFDMGKSTLTSVILPDSLTSIGQSAFGKCPELKMITIPSSVSSIGFLAFAYCTSLDSISIPSSVNYIGAAAFLSCTSLKSFTLLSPSPIDMSRSDEVFSNVDLSACTLYIPFGTKSSFQKAGKWMDFKNMVEMPGLFSSSNSVSLSNVAGSYSLYISSNVTWTASSDKEWLKVIPSKSIGNDSLLLQVEELKEGKRMGTVTLYPEGLDSQTICVTQYGNQPVSAGTLHKILGDQKKTLTTLSLSGTIDASDFKTIRDSMPVLIELNLRDVSVVSYSGPDGTNFYTDYSANTIPDNAFYNLKNLKSVILPTSITSIGNSAFEFCTGLTTIDIPDGVTTIGPNAFQYCSGLESVKIPNSVKTIDEHAFHLCEKLSNITIPSSVKSIGNSAFWCCTNLAKLDIPSSVDTIALYAFGRSTAFLNVDPNNPKYSSIDGLLYNKNQTHLIQCPNILTGRFTIPSSVTAIERSAFVGCTLLRSLSIPDSVNTLGSSAFYDCTGLKYIIVNWKKPFDLGNTFKPFENVNIDDCILYVPDGTVALYRKALGWKDFKNILEVSKNDSPIIPDANSSFKFYPNPTSGSLTIDMGNSLTPYDINIYNELGIKLISVIASNSRQNLDLTNLSKGIYFLSINNGKNQITRKLIIR